MHLKFQREHKSIKHLPIDELPNFTVVTGANGAGKTHFLEAIVTGHIQVVGIQTQTIKYYNWSQLVTPDDAEVQPRQLEDKRNEICKALANFCKGHQEIIMHHILQYRRSNPNGLQPAPTKQQLYDAVNKPVPKSVNDAHTEDDIVAYFVNTETNAFHARLTEARLNGNTTLYYTNFQNDSSSQSLTRDYAAVLEQIAAKSSKPFFALTSEDCQRLFPLTSKEQDPFVGSLTELFAGYVSARMKNATNKTLATDFNTPVDFLNNEEFLAQYGQAPWDVFNQVLREAKLGFRFREPSPDSSIPLQARLHHILSDSEVPFSQLSSGERILVSLAHFLFFSKDPRQPTSMPALILLDEVDAPLHPSMTVDLLRTITKVVVEQYGRKVILATHSPSTVALAPNDSIYVMDVETKLLRKVSRDEGVKALMIGVPVLSINTANRRQVFVESPNDVLFYDKLYQKLSNYLIPEVSLSFISSGDSRTNKNGVKVSNCTQVISITHLLREKGNKLIWGIIDWDTTNSESESVKVLGNCNRYNIESYLLDPLLVAAFLLREKLVQNSDMGLIESESYNALRIWEQPRIQLISDWVVNKVGQHLGQTGTERTKASLINGFQIEIPTWYLHYPGHDLEIALITVFPELGKIKRNTEELLKIDILTKVVDDFPEIVSVDILDTFRAVQSE